MNENQKNILPKNKAFFLDRDGTVIENKGYICHLSQSTIYPFAYEAIRLMNEAGFMVICITNQSSIARGICTPQQVEKLHHQLTQALAQKNALMEIFYYSPYHRDAVIEEYRKESPYGNRAPGMLLQAAKDHDIDLTQSYMIGDNISDIEAGKHAGCRTALVLTGHGQEMKSKLQELNISPDIISQDLLTAAKAILS